LADEEGEDYTIKELISMYGVVNKDLVTKYLGDLANEVPRIVIAKLYRNPLWRKYLVKAAKIYLRIKQEVQ